MGSFRKGPSREKEKGVRVTVADVSGEGERKDDVKPRIQGGQASLYREPKNLRGVYRCRLRFNRLSRILAEKGRKTRGKKLGWQRGRRRGDATRKRETCTSAEIVEESKENPITRFSIFLANSCTSMRSRTMRTVTRSHISSYIAPCNFLPFLCLNCE